MTVTKITSPQALSVVMEIRSLVNSLKHKQESLQKEMEQFLENTQKQVEENHERLRLELNLPQLINPRLDLTYIDQTGDVFLHHGVEQGEGTMMDMLIKNLTGQVEH